MNVKCVFVTKIVFLNQILFFFCLLYFPPKRLLKSYVAKIRRKLRIWSHLLKKSLIENFIFCVVNGLALILYKTGNYGKTAVH